MKMEYEKTLLFAMSKWNLLRGVMALSIVLGHCSMEFVDEPLILALFHKFNLVWVGVFFFLSGWGLFRSYDVKESYLKGFVWKKTRKILSMTLVVFLFEFMIRVLLGGETLVYKNVFSFLLDYVVSTNWYMWELLFFYFVFYVVKCVIKDDRKQILAISIITIGLIVFAYYFLPKSYYTSAVGFVCGCGTYVFRIELQRVFDKHKYSVAMLGLLVAIVCIGLSSQGDKSFLSVLGKNGMCIAICLLGTLFLMFINIDFSFLKPLAEVSLWIYLYHIPLIKAFRYIWEKVSREIDILYVVVVVGTTLIFAYVIANGLKWTTKRLFGAEKI